MIVVLAHQVEAMARQKKLKSLEEYLKPARKRVRRRRAANNNAQVAAHLDAIAKRQQEQSNGG